MIDLPSIKIQAEADVCRARMLQLARMLGLSTDRPLEGDIVLQVTETGLQLVEWGSSVGAVRAEFVTGMMAHRRKYGGGKGQLIARAVGIESGIRPSVWDVTAGLGRDAFVLATLGCQVTLIERHPVIQALLAEGLTHAAQHHETAEIVSRMTLLQGDAVSLMASWQDTPPAVIYLDPMFPHRDKSALVKKEMRLFRKVVGDDADADDLLRAALALATHRVVVKRPRKAPSMKNVEVSYRLEGKSSRYDVYAKKSLKSRV